MPDAAAEPRPMHEPYVAINGETLQPGCVLIQALLGGDRDLMIEHFGDDDWQVDGIDSMVPCPEKLCARAAEARRLDLAKT